MNNARYGFWQFGLDAALLLLFGPLGLLVVAARHILAFII